MIWTSIEARKASDAFGVMPDYFGLGVDTFNIVAPETVKWTAFHEHGGAYPRTIFGGKSLDVEYEPFS